MLRFLFWPHELGVIPSPPATFWPMLRPLKHPKACQSHHLVGLFKGPLPGTGNPIEFPPRSSPLPVVCNLDTQLYSSSLLVCNLNTNAGYEIYSSLAGGGGKGQVAILSESSSVVKLNSVQIFVWVSDV